VKENMSLIRATAVIAPHQPHLPSPLPCAVALGMMHAMMTRGHATPRKAEAASPPNGRLLLSLFPFASPAPDLPFSELRKDKKMHLRARCVLQRVLPAAASTTAASRGPRRRSQNLGRARGT